MKKSSTLRRRSRLYELCKLLVCLTNFVCLVSLNNLFKTYQKLKFKSALDYPPVCYRHVSDGCVTQFWLRQLFTLAVYDWICVVYKLTSWIVKVLYLLLSYLRCHNVRLSMYILSKTQVLFNIDFPENVFHLLQYANLKHFWLEV